MKEGTKIRLLEDIQYTNPLNHFCLLNEGDEFKVSPQPADLEEDQFLVEASWGEQWFFYHSDKGILWELQYNNGDETLPSNNSDA